MACGDEETLPKAVLAYSHSWLPAQVDGVAVRMMAHVKAMVARGVKVTVVTPDFVLPADAAAGSKQAPQLDAIEGVEHLTVRSQLTPIYRKNMCSEFSIKNLRTFVQIIRRTKPDLVHGTTEAAMQVLATACMICGVPLVISMHTDVAAIAASDKHFSNLGSGCIGRLHAKAGVFFTYWGYRNWAIAGATYFCVSRQARAIMDTAGVRSTRVADGLWGPMVDREIFRIYTGRQSRGRAAATQLRHRGCFPHGLRWACHCREGRGVLGEGLAAGTAALHLGAGWSRVASARARTDAWSSTPAAL